VEEEHRGVGSRGRQEAEEAPGNGRAGQVPAPYQRRVGVERRPGGFASCPAPDAVITYVRAMSARESATRDR